MKTTKGKVLPNEAIGGDRWGAAPRLRVSSAVPGSPELFDRFHGMIELEPSF